MVLDSPSSISIYSPFPLGTLGRAEKLNWTAFVGPRVQHKLELALGIVAALHGVLDADKRFAISNSHGVRLIERSPSVPAYQLPVVGHAMG